MNTNTHFQKNDFFFGSKERRLVSNLDTRGDAESQDTQKKLEEKIQNLTVEERKTLEADLVYLKDNSDEKNTKIREEKGKKILETLGYDTTYPSIIFQVETDLQLGINSIFASFNLQEATARELLNKVQQVPIAVKKELADAKAQIEEKRQLKDLRGKISKDEVQPTNTAHKIEKKELTNAELLEAGIKAVTPKGEYINIPTSIDLDHSRLARSIQLYTEQADTPDAFEGIESIQKISRADALPKMMASIIIAKANQKSDMHTLNVEDIFANTPLGEFVVEKALENTGGNKEEAQKHIPKILSSLLYTAQGALNQMEESGNTLIQAATLLEKTDEEGLADFEHVRAIGTADSNLYEIGDNPHKYIVAKYINDNEPHFEVQTNKENEHLLPEQLREILETGMISNGQTAIVHSGDQLLTLPIKEETINEIHAKNKEREIHLSSEYHHIDISGDWEQSTEDEERGTTSADQIEDISNITEILASNGEGLAVTPEGKIFVEYDLFLDTKVFGRLDESPYSRMANFYKEKEAYWGNYPEKAAEMRKMQSLMISYDYITRRDGDTEIGNDYTKKVANFPIFQKLFYKETPLRFDEIMTQEKEEHDIPVGEMDMLVTFQNLVLTGKIDLQNPEAVRTFWENVEGQGRMALQSDEAIKEALEKELTGDELKKHMQEFKEKFNKPFTESGDDFATQNAVPAGMYLAGKLAESLGTTTDTILAHTAIEAEVNAAGQEFMKKVEQNAQKEFDATQNLISTFNKNGKPVFNINNTWDVSFGLNIVDGRNNWQKDQRENGDWREIDRNQNIGEWETVNSAFRDVLANSDEIGRDREITGVNIVRVEGSPEVTDTYTEITGTSINTTSNTNLNAIADSVAHEHPTRYIVVVEATTTNTTEHRTDLQETKVIEIPVTVTTTTDGKEIIEIEDNYIIIEDSDQERVITTLIKEERDVKIKKSIRKKRVANRTVSFEALTEAYKSQDGSLFVNAGFGGKALFNGSEYQKGFVDFLVKGGKSVQINPKTSLNQIFGLGANLLGEGKNSANLGIGMDHKTENGKFSLGANAGLLMTDFLKDLLPKYSANIGYNEDFREGEKWAEGVFGDFDMKNPLTAWSTGLIQRKNPAELSKKLDKLYADFRAEMEDPKKREVFVAYLEQVAFPNVKNLSDEQKNFIHNELYPLYMDERIGKEFFGTLIERGIRFGRNGADDFVALTATFIIGAKQKFYSSIETNNPAITARDIANLSGDINNVNKNNFSIDKYERPSDKPGYKKFSVIPEGEEFEELTRNVTGGFVRNLTEVHVKVHGNAKDWIIFNDNGTFDFPENMPLQIGTVVKAGDVRIIETHIGDPKAEIMKEAVFSPSLDLASSGGIDSLRRVGLQEKSNEQQKQEIHERITERLKKETRLAQGFESELENMGAELLPRLERFEKEYLDTYPALRHSIRRSTETDGRVLRAEAMTWEQEASYRAMDIVVEKYIDSIDTGNPLRPLMEEYRKQGLSSEGMIGEILKQITAKRSGKPTWSAADRNRKKETFTNSENGPPLLNIAKADLAKIMGIDTNDLKDIFMGCDGASDGPACTFTEETTQGDAETIETEYGAKGVLSLTNYDNENNFIGLNRIKTTNVKMYNPRKFSAVDAQGNEWVIYTGYYKECHNPSLFAYKKPGAQIISSSIDKNIRKSVKATTFKLDTSLTRMDKFGNVIIEETEERERTKTTTEKRSTSESVGERSETRYEEKPFIDVAVEESIKEIQELTQLSSVETTVSTMTILRGIWSEGGMEAFNDLTPEAQKREMEKEHNAFRALFMIGQEALGYDRTSERESWRVATEAMKRENFDIRDLPNIYTNQNDQQKVRDYIKNTLNINTFDTP